MKTLKLLLTSAVLFSSALFLNSCEDESSEISPQELSVEPQVHGPGLIPELDNSDNYMGSNARIPASDAVWVDINSVQEDQKGFVMDPPFSSPDGRVYYLEIRPNQVIQRGYNIWHDSNNFLYIDNDNGQNFALPIWAPGSYVHYYEWIWDQSAWVQVGLVNLQE